MFSVVNRQDNYSASGAGKNRNENTDEIIQIDDAG